MREGPKERGERDVGRSSFVLSRAILMRRTCYMEWNKGWRQRGEEEDGEKGGIVARKRRAAPCGILRRVTHARRICVQDATTEEGVPSSALPLHFNNFLQEKRII